MREFRQASSHDDFDIANVSVEGWRFAYKGIMKAEKLNALDLERRARGRSNFIKENPLSTLVCIESEKLVGFVDFEKSRDRDADQNVGEIWAIYVLPEYLGKNIGKELFSKSLNELLEQGCSEVTVWVLKDNILARKFYERQGLIADGAEKEYEGLVEVRYRKKL